MPTLEEAIAAVVDGDVLALAQVARANHEDVRDSAANLAPLAVSRSALINVLTLWRRGGCADGDVRRWASFVRRGYVAETAALPISPVEIDYDEGDEHLIVEIISRFDELGDLIDGQIDAEEQEQMMRALQT